MDEKKAQVTSSPVLLLASSYNITTSSYERLNIDIKTLVDEVWRVVLEVENVSNVVKVRFYEDS